MKRPLNPLDEWALQADFQALMEKEYARTIELALANMRKWMKARKLRPKDLPEHPFDLPDDCPLHSAGLSMAQAMHIFQAAKQPDVRSIDEDWCK
jgi:hypothetical protein